MENAYNVPMFVPDYWFGQWACHKLRAGSRFVSAQLCPCGGLSCRHLDLSRTKIDGVLPTSIGLLTALTYVHVYI